jgi:glycosyltransferase involved in cell wall biosynthesis
MTESKRKLILVPIEPLAERYSESWYRNLPKLFGEAGFAVTIIQGSPLEDTVKVGTFLDINSTVHYKMAQLQRIASLFHRGEVEPGTVFFFSDIEFWGLESVRLLSQLNGVPVKMCGFLHAASYTREDAFAVAARYQKYIEVGWLACLDAVFVGSHYHKQVLCQRRIYRYAERSDIPSLTNRIHVTRNPLFLDDYAQPKPKAVKQKKVLLTNRFDSEKRPGETLALFQQLKAEFSDWRFIITTGRSSLERSNAPDLVRRARALEAAGVVEIKDGLNKSQYHEELSSAAIVVSHSIEENYGYCIAEALIYGVVPLLRKGLSHDEFVDEDNRFLFDNQKSPADDLHQARKLLESFGTEEWPEAPSPDVFGAQRILQQVIKLGGSLP